MFTDSNRIQGVTVSCGETTNTYSITCIFLAGSNVHGCSYILTDANNTVSVNGAVMRNNGNIGTTLMEIPDIQKYSRIVAYALDRNKMIIYVPYLFKSYNITGECASK